MIDKLIKISTFTIYIVSLNTKFFTVCSLVVFIYFLFLARGHHLNFLSLFIPCHMLVAGYCGIWPEVCLSYICLSVFSFQDDNFE